MEAVRDIVFQDKSLESVWEKTLGGVRLDAEDGLTILTTDDLIAVGRMADYVNQKRNGKDVLFVLNRQINPTNICIYACKFCDFAVRLKDEDAYVLTDEEILAKCENVREVHIVGGMHPRWKFEDYLRIVRLIHQTYPTVQIKAFTAVEIDWFARLKKTSYEDILNQLREAGQVSMPGGGAEVFSERVRRELFHQKIGEKEWLAVHRTAHRMGIRSNATMLYGHIETYEERVDHILKLRALQDETGGFYSFIPLAFQPGHTGLVTRQASALEDLRTIACSRLLLDNFDHIKSYWVMLGEATAQVALHWGASDIDGTIGEEKIAHAALASSELGHEYDSMVRMIRGADRIPVERDALYNVVRRLK